MPIPQQLLEDIRNNVYCEDDLTICGEALKENLDDGDIPELIDCLKQNKYIKRLRLPYTEIGDESAEILSKLDFLIGLDVSHTKVRKIGVQTLLRSRIKELSISSLSIKDDWLEGIGENSTLDDLMMYSNLITSQGVELISKNKSIKSINVSRNSIDDEGVRSFCKMKSLKYLTIGGNKVTNVGREILSNSKIKHIYLDGYEINNENKNDDDSEDRRPQNPPITISFNDKRAREPSEEKEDDVSKRRKVVANGGPE